MKPTRVQVASISAYLVCVIAVCFLIALDRGRARAFETARSFDVNHRIAAGDVVTAGLGFRMLEPSRSRLREFEGRYSTEFYCPHERIELATTSAHLDVGSDVPDPLEWVTLPNPHDPRIDANVLVDVCPSGKSCLGRRRVVALACDAAGSLCRAAIPLPKRDRAVVLAAHPAPLRLLFAQAAAPLRRCK